MKAIKSVLANRKNLLSNGLGTLGGFRNGGPVMADSIYDRHMFAGGMAISSPPPSANSLAMYPIRPLQEMPGTSVGGGGGVIPSLAGLGEQATQYADSTAQAAQQFSSGIQNTLGSGGGGGGPGFGGFPPQIRQEPQISPGFLQELLGGGHQAIETAGQPGSYGPSLPPLDQRMVGYREGGLVPTGNPMQNRKSRCYIPIIRWRD